MMEPCPSSVLCRIWKGEDNVFHNPVEDFRNVSFLFGLVD